MVSNVIGELLVKDRELCKEPVFSCLLLAKAAAALAFSLFIYQTPAGIFNSNGSSPTNPSSASVCSPSSNKCLQW
jgi:hypothetical protein